jgi:hypothetical protein
MMRILTIFSKAVLRILMGICAGAVLAATYLGITGTDPWEIDPVDGDTIIHLGVKIGAGIGGGVGLQIGSWEIRGKLLYLVVGALVGLTLGPIIGGGVGHALMGGDDGTYLGILLGVMVGGTVGGLIGLAYWCAQRRVDMPKVASEVRHD